MTASERTSPTAGAASALHGRSIRPERFRVAMGWFVNTRAVSLVKCAAYNEGWTRVNLAGPSYSRGRARREPALRLTRESNPRNGPGTLAP
jgi:hypothetical protein